METPDHFALFGLPERFELDLTELERRYLALSRELHPDRHAMGSPRERLVAVQRTTDLNLAYKVLRSEFLRAEHLLRRRGIEVAGDDATRQTVDGGLLMEIMELREALGDARAAKSDAQCTAVRDDVQARSDRSWHAIRSAFATLADGDEAALAAIAAQLTALRYYRRILEEISNLEEEERP